MSPYLIHKKVSIGVLKWEISNLRANGTLMSGRKPSQQREMMMMTGRSIVNNTFGEWMGDWGL